ncbi:MAG TPA: hypothetical protein VI544_00530 [Candidatus Nanoarchaeia archaeon]|nr:hypothetical protein [Candidatus Nanoarchaeia archaeon]
MKKVVVAEGCRYGNNIGCWTPRNFTLARVEDTAEYVSACTSWRL